MSTVTQVRMWNDIGYTEGCLEVPRKGTSIPQPSYTVSDLNISVQDMFSRMKLRAPYTSLMNISYLEMTVDMNNGSDLTIYGWVDSVSLSSDTDGYPMTTIDWHVDYWRTYLDTAVFGSGMVRRRPLLTDDTVPPQPYPYRYLDYRGFQSLCGASYIWWVVYFVTSGGTDSQITWRCFPVDIGNEDTKLYIGSHGVTAPSLADVAIGEMDEVLGLNPESIGYAFLSPVSPMLYTGTGTSDSPIIANIGSGWANPSTESPPKTDAFLAFSSDCFRVTSVSFNQVVTSDTDIYIITDMMGSTVGTLPWGIAVNSCQVKIVADTTSACVNLRFYDGSGIIPLESSSKGLMFNIPCIPVPVTANAWSSYVYSGARQAEIDLRRLQAESQAVSGGISTGVSAASGALSGAMMGAMTGAVGGPVGMLVGALIGAGTSAFTGALSTGANYAYQTGSYADEMQSISDYKASHQANSVLINGGGWDVLHNGIGGVSLVHMVKDDYSLEQRQNDIDLYGVNVSEPMESVQELVDAGGPLQVSNLTVRGNIPVEAKQYFRNRFTKGVRMI